MALQTPGIGGGGAAPYMRGGSPRTFPQTDSVGEAAGGIARVMEILQARKRDKALSEIFQQAGPGVAGMEQAQELMFKHGLYNEGLAMGDRVFAARKAEADIRNVESLTAARDAGVDMAELEREDALRAAAIAAAQAAERDELISQAIDDGAGPAELAPLLARHGHHEASQANYEVADMMRGREIDQGRLNETERHNREDEAIRWASLQHRIQTDAAAENADLSPAELAAIEECREHYDRFDNQMRGGPNFEADEPGAERTRLAAMRSCRPVITNIQDVMARCKALQEVDNKFGIVGQDDASRQCVDLESVLEGQQVGPEAPDPIQAGLNQDAPITPEQNFGAPRVPAPPGQNVAVSSVQGGPGSPPVSQPGVPGSPMATGMTVDDVDAILRAGGV